ncbi:hypothetical protein PInf_024707 [Phytophthora infestans]|nr:hypothetical protein PInf_024707 [Phytophthora infestans]
MPVYENSQVVANLDAAAGDYSKLTSEEITLADKLDHDGAVCSVAIGAVNDWGTPNVAIGSTAEGILSVVNTLNLALAPQMKRALEVAPLLRSFFSGCRVRVVNTTGVYVEDGLCSTGDVCVHNMYNTVWEYTNSLAAADPTRVIQIISVFRSRYADTVALSMLPGAIVAQILLMGIVSLYQVMSSKRSVLLSQIWAYRCQNGRMQAAYLAQVMYHFAFNSDMYYLGLSTGTLSSASIMNLALSFFAFSYSFINVIKARAGEQALDRDFRLLWEVVILTATGCVAGVLSFFRYTSLSFIGDPNGDLLRLTSARGAKYCGLKDSCYVFIVNLGD